ncbi:PAX-interacting protein 1-like [Bombina bombina]|uniref:PAX-interacting protein 1-like n=1 Tax=Bombina bombina TaxID=8345 RepID=UPI00235A88E8|nr:PAX-interacting protein 1-like [Bombina bombina]
MGYEPQQTHPPQHWQYMHSPQQLHPPQQLHSLQQLHSPKQLHPPQQMMRPPQQHTDLHHLYYMPPTPMAHQESTPPRPTAPTNVFQTMPSQTTSQSTIQRDSPGTSQQFVPETPGLQQGPAQSHQDDIQKMIYRDLRLSRLQQQQAFHRIQSQMNIHNALLVHLVEAVERLADRPQTPSSLTSSVISLQDPESHLLASHLAGGRHTRRHTSPPKYLSSKVQIPLQELINIPPKIYNI